MSNDSLSSIRTAIQTILSGVTQLQNVYLGHVLDISGFPACRFFLVGTTEVPQDNRVTYWRTYRFQIEILQEMKNKDKQSAEADFEDAVQAVLDALDANPYLTTSGHTHCDEKHVTVGQVRVEDFWFGAGMMMALTLEVKTAVQF
jgi:hypothetical protein